jgi:hypothetical protein
MPAPKGKKSLQTSLDDLRKSINGRAGLLEHGLPAFTSIFVKAIFNEITKPNYSRFPGKWISSLKGTNGVKNNIGIIYKLGYETACPSPQKVIAVTKTTVAKKSDVKKTSNKTDTSKEKVKSKHLELIVQDAKTLPKGITHREFRLGVCLLLPYIDPKAKESLKDQLSKDPLTLKDKTIVNYYKSNRNIIDALNLAYATKAAIGRKGSKATTLGYRSARGHAISLTANIEWMDANGTKYQAFKDIPEHIGKFLLSLLNRKLVEGAPQDADDKDPEEEQSSSSEEDEEEETEG